MSRTSTVVWSIIGLVIVVLGALGLIYGPELYREGKAVVGPILEMAQAEDRLAALNVELPFTEPADGSVSEARFVVFLDIRRELLPQYAQRQDIERKLQGHVEEDWDSAKELLTAIQQVMALQLETLEAHRMSPAEFVWIEDLAYQTWAENAADAIEASTTAEELRHTTTADRELLAELELRHGSSRASSEFAAHLDQRLLAMDNPEPPVVEGMSEATTALFWAHRAELEELDLGAYSQLHRVLRGSNDVDIEIDRS